MHCVFTGFDRLPVRLQLDDSSQTMLATYLIVRRAPQNETFYAKTRELPAQDRHVVKLANPDRYTTCSTILAHTQLTPISGISLAFHHIRV
jgi:hypothetical protein